VVIFIHFSDHRLDAGARAFHDSVNGIAISGYRFGQTQ